MPLPRSKRRITMEAVGSPEYWVEFRVITGMKFDDVKRLFGAAKEDAPPDEYIYDLFKNLVIDWNLPEEEGGEVMPLPREQSSSVGKLPNSYVSYLVQEMSEDTGVPDTENLDEIS